MSTVRKLNESALRGIYDAYMHEAFPPAELKPLAVMLRLMERGRYLCYGYYRNGRLAAYAFFYRHDSRVLLLDYFAVTPELRGRGVGSAFLAALDAVLGGVCIRAKWRCPTAMTPA
ncbi:MAG: GNAT family N-acetyltransferase [Ruthenibacterium lactatiformans]